MADELENPVEPTEPESGAATPEPGKPGAKFTQAELDNHIAERLKREREKYKGYDDLKKKAESYDKQEADKLSEQEKLQKALADATAKVEQADAKRKQALIKAEVVAKMQGKVASDRMQAAYKLLDVSALTVTDADEVEGVDAALKKLLEDNPFLGSEDKKQSAGLSATNPAGGTPVKDNLDWLLIRQGNKGKTFGKGRIDLPGEPEK